MLKTKLQEKLNESLKAVLPIIGIVLLLCFTVAPMPTSILMAFLIGAVLLIVGMMLFNLGAELAMSPMGERVGASITQTKRVWLMLPLGFVLGFLITISEPDLQVLANQVPSVPNAVLIVTVAVGVGPCRCQRCCWCFMRLCSCWRRLCRAIFWPSPSTPAASRPGR